MDLTNTWEDEADPAWSPDGQFIAFCAGSQQGLDLITGRPRNCTLAVIKVDGTGRRTLAKAGMGISHPSWAPDGQRMIFTRELPDGSQICVIDANDNSCSPITDGSGFDRNPAWSPDGQWVLFTSHRCGHAEGAWVRNRDLYVMRPDGSDARRITFHGCHDDEAAWSPDGKEIVFRSFYRDGKRDLYVMKVDLENPQKMEASVKRLTFAPGENELPAWGPPAAATKP